MSQKQVTLTLLNQNLRSLLTEAPFCVEEGNFHDENIPFPWFWIAEECELDIFVTKNLVAVFCVCSLYNSTGRVAINAAVNRINANCTLCRS